MPSLLHEGLPQVLRDHPKLMATILTELLGVTLPHFDQVRTVDAALPKLVPVEYHADAVILFVVNGVPVYGVIVETQLQEDPRKRYTLPVYALTARARYECPFVVVVMTPDAKVAEWAAEPIDLGLGITFRVLVIGPNGVPKITEPERAARDPYLAMLSVMAHGQGDPETAVVIAQATTAAIRTLLKEDQRMVYWFIILSSLGESARKAFEMLPNIRPFLNETQRQAFAEAEARGKAEGKAEAILRLLTKRGIDMTDAQRQRILACTDLATLDGWFDRALTVAAFHELFA